MKKLHYLALLSVVWLTGCASSHMSPTDPAAPTPEQAVITFYRSSMIGSAIQAPIAQESGQDVEFVGVASVGTKIQKIVAPGKYRFVVGGESCHLLEADVEAGKSYYAYVAPRIGWLKARFRLLTQGQDKIEEAIETCVGLEPVAINKSGESWFAGHKESMLDKLNEAKADHDPNNVHSNMRPDQGVPFTQDPNLKISQ